jgi:hypothetical protein
MSAITDAVDALTTKVTGEETVVDSCLALLNGLAEQLRQNAGVPAAINAIADRISAKAQVISDAVVANTPQA